MRSAKQRNLRRRGAKLLPRLFFQHIHRHFISYVTVVTVTRSTKENTCQYCTDPCNACNAPCATVTVSCQGMHLAKQVNSACVPKHPVF